MPKTALATLVNHCDKILRTREIGDYDGAVNGLQVGNRGTVTRLAATVDASLATVKLAIAAKADLLIVHHGLFWSPSHPWTGKRYELLQLLVENNLAVYSSHLPLDAHPKLGDVGQRYRRKAEYRVIDQEIDGPKRLFDLPDKLGRCLSIRNIALRRNGLDAEVFNL